MGKNLVFCCFFLCLLVTAAVTANGEKLQTFTVEYRHFDSTSDAFEVAQPAVISNNALQLTPDSACLSPFALTYTSGRILLKKPFKLWERAAVASFNTSFLINVYRVRDGPPGEGMAFLIAPDLEVPPNSFGQFLGLTNSWTDGRGSNKLVAVEFDATCQFFDPDDNHVGININSIKSVKTEYLTPHNITISPPTTRFYNVWLDYDGLNRVIDVYIAEQDDLRG